MNNANSKNTDAKCANAIVNASSTNPINMLKHSSHSRATERDTKRNMGRSLVPNPIPPGPIFFPAPVMNQSSSNSSTTTNSQRAYRYFHWAPSKPWHMEPTNNNAEEETAADFNEGHPAAEEGHGDGNGTLESLKIKRAKLELYNCQAWHM